MASGKPSKVKKHLEELSQVFKPKQEEGEEAME